MRPTPPSPCRRRTQKESFVLRCSVRFPCLPPAALPSVVVGRRSPSARDIWRHWADYQPGQGDALLPQPLNELQKTTCPCRKTLKSLARDRASPYPCAIPTCWPVASPAPGFPPGWARLSRWTPRRIVA
jgi:hypothetical protein